MQQQPKTEQEIDLLCNVPGPEGVMWRLVKQWNPDGIQAWLAGETIRGTPVHDLTRALGNMLAAAAFGFGMQTDNPREAVIGQGGVVPHFNASLQAKVNTYRQTAPSGIIMPTPGELQ